MHATPTMAAPMSRAPASLSRGQAAAAAVARPPVPTNLIGKPLDQTPWVPFAPAAERLVTVRLYIDGARMKPPQERLYEDQILWNAYEPAESVRKFSEELCMAEGLPAAYTTRSSARSGARSSRPTRRRTTRRTCRRPAH